MIVTFKLREDFKFDASKEDVVNAAHNLSVKKGRANGYFIQIESEEYRMMDVIKQMILDKGLEIPTISKMPYDFSPNFEKLGFKIWKKVWLSTIEKVLFWQDSRNMFNDFALSAQKKLYSDHLTFDGREFISLKKFKFNDGKFLEVRTFEKAELESGLLLITTGLGQNQDIVFVENVENPNKFMNNMSLAIEQIKPVLRFADREESFEKALSLEIKNGENTTLIQES